MNPRMPRAREELGAWLDVARGLKSHVFVLTSGSTAATPADFKWVALSKAAVLSGAEGSNSHLGCHSKDVWLHCLPEFHVGGLAIWARAELACSRVVRLDGRWSPVEFDWAARKHKASLASLVPAQLHDLLRLGTKSAPPSLRAVLVGGGALSPNLCETARARGWPVLRTYGMSEAASQVATEPAVGLDEDSRYRVLPHLEASAAPDGRLQVRGNSMLTGYVSLDADGKPHLWDPKDAEGWFTTEDYGTVSEGWLTIAGRAADRLKIGGELTNLHLLAMTLYARMEGLVDDEKVTLLGLPDDRLEWVVALVAEAGVDPLLVSRLVERFNEAVLPFERIRRQFVVEKIPRTDLGKVKRAELLALVSTP